MLWRTKLSITQTLSDTQGHPVPPNVLQTLVLTVRYRAGKQRSKGTWSHVYRFKMKSLLGGKHGLTTDSQPLLMAYPAQTCKADLGLGTAVPPAGFMPASSSAPPQSSEFKPHPLPSR